MSKQLMRLYSFIVNRVPCLFLSILLLGMSCFVSVQSKADGPNTIPIVVSIDVSGSMGDLSPEMRARMETYLNLILFTGFSDADATSDDKVLVNSESSLFVSGLCTTTCDITSFSFAEQITPPSSFTPKSKIWPSIFDGWTRLGTAFQAVCNQANRSAAGVLWVSVSDDLLEDVTDQIQSEKDLLITLAAKYSAQSLLSVKIVSGDKIAYVTVKRVQSLDIIKKQLEQYRIEIEDLQQQLDDLIGRLETEPNDDEILDKINDILEQLKVINDGLANLGSPTDQPTNVEIDELQDRLRDLSTPDSFELLTPAPGESTSDGNVLFTWQRAPKAWHYKLIITKQNEEISTDLVDSETYSITLPPGEYKWSVQAIGASSEFSRTAEGAMHNLVVVKIPNVTPTRPATVTPTAACPQPFKALEPLNGAIQRGGVVTLTWESSVNALEYEVLITQANKTLTDIKHISTNMVTIPLANGSYSWQVIAWGSPDCKELAVQQRGMGFRVGPALPTRTPCPPGTNCEPDGSWVIWVVLLAVLIGGGIGIGWLLRVIPVKLQRMNGINEEPQEFDLGVRSPANRILLSQQTDTAGQVRDNELVFDIQAPNCHIERRLNGFFLVEDGAEAKRITLGEEFNVNCSSGYQVVVMEKSKKGKILDESDTKDDESDIEAEEVKEDQGGNVGN